MKRAGLIISVVAVSLGATTVAAFAKGGHGGRGGERASFSELDADGNGLLTQAELQARGAAHFATADTNSDGALSKDELVAAASKRAGDRAVRRAERLIERLDANNDGMLSQDELQARGGNRMARMFTALDTDNDGMISEAEFDARKTLRKKRGQNGDAATD